MKRILSGTDLHRVVLHENPNRTRDTLLITFASMGDHLADDGFATGFALKNGYDTVYVSQHREAKHQGLSAEHFRDLMAPLMSGRPVVTYGTSLGGYAALYFGTAINAKIIAFSPRNGYHPSRDVGRLDPDCAWPWRHAVKLSEIGQSPIRPVIVYDPLQTRDKRFVDEWAREAYPDAHLRPVWMTGHRPITQMAKAGALTSFARAAIEGEAPEIPNVWPAGTPTWHDYEGFKAKAEGKPDAALAAFMASADIKPSVRNLSEVITLASKLGCAEAVAGAAATARSTALWPDLHHKVRTMATKAA